MLQQTRVEAVIPYYERWMNAFPDVDALADAPLDNVLKNWEGLGYYSRARNLHNAARVVREQFAGTVPSTYDALRELPGVGDYTAGAVLSIAYNEPAPAVDGNVRRVISRLYDVDASAAELRSYAADLVDSERPGDFNQSLMELGARICTPRNPSCFACPVASQCDAYRNQTVHLRPAVKPKKEIPHHIVRTIVHVDGNRVLIAQRPATGLLAGLWEFTTRDIAPKTAAHVGEVVHVFTHQRITYDVHLLRSKRSAKNNERWVRLSDLQHFALPTAQRKIEKLVRAVLPHRS